MRKSDILNRLQGVPLFEFCTVRDLRILERHGERLTAPAGSDLVVQDHDGSAFYLVLDGDARVIRNNRTIARLGSGDHFGELALLDPSPRNATVRAETDVTVLVISHRMFNVVMRDLPGLRRAMLRSMAQRLRTLDRSL